MIDEVQVRNLALIKEATLRPSSGLTVLTGETGAGKTALLQAMHLLIGERADKTAIRDGEAELAISGRLFIPACLDNDADAEDDSGDACSAADESEEVVIARTVSADGRSRVTINGMMASVNELADRVAGHIDLCGQHEHQKLIRVASHCGLLDMWARERISEPLRRYQEAFAEAQTAAADLASLNEALSANAVRLEDARFTLRQIDAVAPKPGEYEELSASLSRAEHAESLALAANEAYEALHEDGGALDAVTRAAHALEAVAHLDDTLAAMAQGLREAGIMIDDAADSARAYRDATNFDPVALQQAHERLAAIQGLLRTYGPRVEDVLAAREEAASYVAMADDADERLRKARKRVDAAEAALAHAAYALKAAREQAAPRFAQAVTAQMARLEMGSAELTCELADRPREQWSMQGPHSVEFLFAPGTAMQPRPLARIASGGEISRVMLAIKVVLGAADDVETLVFDEIDAGVGGTTAVALADVLAELAQTHQVIVVTHLSQVAVRGDVHYVVEKTTDAFPQTNLALVEDESRVREIARMLSGSITETSLAHARELLTASR